MWGMATSIGCTLCFLFLLWMPFPAAAGDVLAEDTVYASCPLEFPEKSAKNRPYKFLRDDVYAIDIALLQPSHSGNDWVVFLDQEDRYDLHCIYEKNHQLIVPIPHAATSCRYTRVGKGREIAVCVGPAPQGPVPPQQIFIARPVDYSATLLGFGLRQTPQQVADIAQARNLPISFREEMDNGASRVVEARIAAKTPLTILFSPQTGLSREIAQSFDSMPPDGDAAAQGALGFGRFTNLGGPHGCLSWDQKTGVVLLAECGPEKNAPGRLRLIDDAQTSKEQGAPLGTKKYFPNVP